MSACVFAVCRGAVGLRAYRSWTDKHPQVHTTDDVQLQRVELPQMSEEDLQRMGSLRQGMDQVTQHTRVRTLFSCMHLVRQRVLLHVWLTVRLPLF